MINLPDLKNANVKGKKVFLRADIDVPLSQQSAPIKSGSTINNQSPQMRDPAVAGQSAIEDDTRLIDSLETLKYLLDNGARVILAGHVGRPQDKEKNLSAKPIARWYQNKLKIKNGELKMTKIGELDGWKISDQLFILENIRFNPGEEKNDPVFSRQLASLADIYV